MSDKHMRRLLSATDGLRRFGRAREGAAAVEFALVLPLLVLIFVCYTELSRACDNYKKVILLSRTVSDLTSQGDQTDPIPATKMNDILAASTLVLRPFTGANAKIVVSAVGVYSVSNALKPRICSSYASSNATVRTTGIASDLTVPDGYQTAGMRYVIAEVTMPYAPMLGNLVSRWIGTGKGQFTFVVNTPWPVRGGSVQNGTYAEIRLPNGAACP